VRSRVGNAGQQQQQLAVQLVSFVYVRMGATLHWKLLCQVHRHAEKRSRQQQQQQQQQQQHILTPQHLHCKLLPKPLYLVGSGKQQVHAGPACFAVACGQQLARPLLTVATISHRHKQQQQQQQQLQQVLMQRATQSVCTPACRVCPLRRRSLPLLPLQLLRPLLQPLFSSGEDP
jgi:hypothetical protein